MSARSLLQGRNVVKHFMHVFMHEAAGMPVGDILAKREDVFAGKRPTFPFGMAWGELSFLTVRRLSRSLLMIEPTKTFQTKYALQNRAG